MKSKQFQNKFIKLYKSTQFAKTHSYLLHGFMNRFLQTLPAELVHASDLS